MSLAEYRVDFEVRSSCSSYKTREECPEHYVARRGGSSEGKEGGDARSTVAGGRQEILERLRASAAATFGKERVTEASVREALEASVRAVSLVDSEPLDPMEVEPYRHD